MRLSFTLLRCVQPSKTETFKNARFSLKTPGSRFSLNGPKRRLLKTMPTFALPILDDRVNDNIMLIVAPA